METVYPPLHSTMTLSSSALLALVTGHLLWLWDRLTHSKCPVAPSPGIFTSQGFDHAVMEVCNDIMVEVEVLDISNIPRVIRHEQHMSAEMRHVKEITCD